MREQFQTLAAQLRRADTDAGAVAPWPRQAGDESAAHGIRHDRHDNRDGLGRVLGRANRRSMGHEDVDWEPDEVGREGGEALGLPIRKPPRHGEVLALHPAMLAQPVPEGLDSCGVGTGKEQKSDPANPAWDNVTMLGGGS